MWRCIAEPGAFPRRTRRPGPSSWRCRCSGLQPSWQAWAPAPSWAMHPQRGLQWYACIFLRARSSSYLLKRFQDHMEVCQVASAQNLNVRGGPTKGIFKELNATEKLLYCLWADGLSGNQQLCCCSEVSFNFDFVGRPPTIGMQCCNCRRTHRAHHSWHLLRCGLACRWDLMLWCNS